MNRYREVSREAICGGTYVTYEPIPEPVNWPKRVATALGVAALAAVAAFVLATLPGCASFADAKPALRTVLDIAVASCESYFGQHPEAANGLPIGELCKVGSDVLGPFLDQTTTAVSVAGPQAAELAARRKP